MVSNNIPKEENNTAYALEVLDIYKSFFNNEVLQGINFRVKKGEVVGIVGSNGAGKSTLMKIINGVYKADKGTIKIKGESGNYKDAQGARSCGIAMVYQEFSLIPTMTVSQNIFLGVEPKKSIFIDDTSCINQARKAFKDFNVNIDPEAYIESLSIGDQQIVEIIKALLQQPAVLILDEPTASLTQKEITMLFSFINRLRKQGMSIILISHHLQEVLDICDKVIVLRNGTVVLDDYVKSVQLPEIIQAMIGRKLDKNEYISPGKPILHEKPVLVVESMKWHEKLIDISFELYPGEVLGIAGLMGSGRTEILKNIIGLYEPDSGKVMVNGSVLKTGKPWDAIKNGLFLVPENRHKCGIIAGQSIHHNMLLPIWKKIRRNIFIDDKKGKDIVVDMISKLRIKTTNMQQYIERLSGGNQQKVVFAKCLVTKPKVLLLDDPTVGIDVEAKNEIAYLVRNVADEGNGVILVSSEMEEMARLADRVIVIKQGRISAELSRHNGDQITEQSLTEAIQA